MIDTDSSTDKSAVAATATAIPNSAPDPLPPTPPGAIPSLAPIVPIPPQSVVTEKASTTTTTTISPPFWQGVLSDVHVNASGLLMFVCLSIGVAFPELKPKCTEIAALAGTYLFASAKAK